MKALVLALAVVLLPVLASASEEESPQDCRGTCWISSRAGARIIISERDASGGRQWQVIYAGGIMDRGTQLIVHFACGDSEWRDQDTMNASKDPSERVTTLDCAFGSVLKLTFRNREGVWDNNAGPGEAPSSYDVILR